MLETMILFRSAMTRTGEMALPEKPRRHDWIVMEPVHAETPVEAGRSGDVVRAQILAAE